MTNKTQIEWVKDVLVSNRSISRNFALRNYISRLGAIIKILEYRGWVFKKGYVDTITPFGKGKDYVYDLVKAGHYNG